MTAELKVGTAGHDSLISPCGWPGLSTDIKVLCQEGDDVAITRRDGYEESVIPTKTIITEDNSNFCIFHNIQCLGNKADNLSVFLDDFEFNVICLSEHWVNDKSL
ncbi:hypothetical protein JTB14_017399 [Gonioctena quinquepunctata]|nr:hypothetical protein JTB14_017399 [Gonioctena quinquepunctata]